MTEQTNADRAALALRAVLAYDPTVFGQRDEGVDEVAGDLLSDLLHLIEAQGPSTNPKNNATAEEITRHALIRAWAHYQAERVNARGGDGDAQHLAVILSDELMLSGD